MDRSSQYKRKGAATDRLLNGNKKSQESELKRPSSANRSSLTNGAAKKQNKQWIKEERIVVNQKKVKKQSGSFSSEDDDCNIEDEDFSHQVMDFTQIKASGREERKCSQNIDQTSLSSKNENTVSDVISPLYQQSLQPVEETKDQNSGISMQPSSIVKPATKIVLTPQTSQSLKASSKEQMRKSQSKASSSVESPLQNLMKTHIKKNSLLDAIYSPKKEKLMMEQKREQKRAEMSKLIKKLDLQLKSVEANPKKQKDRVLSFSERASGSKLEDQLDEDASQQKKVKSKNYQILSRNSKQSSQSNTASSPMQIHGIQEIKRNPRESLSRPRSSRVPSTSIPYMIDIPKFSPRDTIEDLLDQEHDIIAQFFQAKGLKMAGYCSPTKADPSMKRKSGVMSAQPLSKTMITANHLQQSDSYYQGLNSQLDNYMKAIAAMISEKNQIYKKNEELVVGVKEENVKVEMSYKEMQRINHQIREELEAGTELKKQIASVRRFVETVKKTHDSRVKIEKGEVKILKAKQKEIEQRIVESANEAEHQAVIYQNEEQKNYTEIKRLNMRSEETAKLIQGLKTNIQYQIALEKERAQMLAEKGRLLDQLICREKLSQQEMKKVKVSREVTREVDKILTPRGSK